MQCLDIEGQSTKHSIHKHFSSSVTTITHFNVVNNFFFKFYDKRFFFILSKYKCNCIFIFYTLNKLIIDEDKK